MRTFRLSVIWLSVTALLVGATAVYAQDGESENRDAPTIADVSFGSQVENTITEQAFWDWWHVQALPGDMIVAQMDASDGLEPLLGLLNQSGDLVARSLDGEVDGTVMIEFEAPREGRYTFVPTRVGNAEGTSTGSYTLRIATLTTRAERVNTRAEVTFRCDDTEVANAVSLRVSPSTVRPQARLIVYGMGDFEPVVRTTVNPEDEATCSRDAVSGYTFTLPESDPVTVAADNPVQVVDLTIDMTESTSVLEISIGSVDGGHGEYLAVLTGFELEQRREEEVVEVRLGPLAAETSELLVYMIGGANSRLNPAVGFSDSPERCDDAGNRLCPDIPSVNRVGVVTEDGLQLVGDRFDAGVRIAAGDLEAHVIALGNSGGDTTGAYGLLLLGSLPPRAAGE